MKNLRKLFGIIFVTTIIVCVMATCELPIGPNPPPTPLPTVTGIAVTNPPAKTQYNLGEELNTTGMVVTASYSDGSKAAVTGYSTSGYVKTALGNQTVTVTYSGKTAGFTVNVVDPNPPTGNSEDFDYEIYDGTIVVIKKYKGTAVNVSIPASIDGKPVTNIGYGAFKDCTSLTSVTIPNSVYIISGEAFSGCTGLVSITVDAANKDYSSQDGLLYNKDKTVLHTYPAGKTVSLISIPSSVNSIGNWAFSGCTGLTSLTIPDNITSIGIGTFAFCANLTSVTIPDKRKMTHFTQLQG